MGTSVAEICSGSKICPIGPSRKFAFTLAEVLITLGIIGVVAAITIPQIVTKIQNKGYVERFKKAYSSLQQATIMIEQETNVSAYNYKNNNISDLYGLYAKYLNLTRTVETIKDRDTTIIKNYQKLKCKYLNNSEASCSGIMNLVAYPFPPLKDGTIIVFRPAPINSAFDWGIHALNSRASFTIDVNGLQKPNQLGRDIFRVYLHNNDKIYAPNNYADNVGIYGADCDPKAEEVTKSRGFSCSYRILTEGKMNY